ncbi:MAG TPA: transcriptional regulator [Sphaerochaeta sp.]|nr:transcriptional regulator [Sphaerochaeta sp.]
MAVTIKDIAREAGVSRGTVDRVLHNRSGVKPEVSQRVRSIASEMGFSPNRAGKVLAARKQPIRFGCLLPSIGNPFFDDLMMGFHLAEKELADFGVSVDILQVKSFDKDIHLKAIAKMKANNYQGLCITSIDVPEVKEAIDAIIASGVPVVTVNTDITATGRMCYVGPDYYHGGRTAAGLLSMITQQELSLLVVTGSFNIKGHNERIKGFTEGLEEHGIPFEVVCTLESLDDDNHAFVMTERCLEKNPMINTIFIAAGGVKGVCNAVTDKPRQKPIRIMSFDDVPATKALVKQGVISFTLCQEPRQQGYVSIQKLFSYLMSEGKTPLEDTITKTIIKIPENIED